ncbi:MAG TPA: AraC family transcriptional regulator ligand-binding domain-containing protein [Pseudolabrys sp.]|nr:AraC family transcriptional regulator ligand-binding domain-containing protein [Pseudolabrys sp.]
MSRLACVRAEKAGIALDPILKKAGLTRSQIENPRLTIGVRDQIEFLNLAAAALNDDLLGFHLAQTPDLRQIGLLYYVLASSQILIDALHRAARYTAIINEGISQTCIDHKAVGMSLHYVGVGRHLDRHQVEFWMTAVVRLCRQLTGLRLLPSRVRFTHRRSQNAEFAEFFGNNVEFGAAADDIVFPIGVGQSPIVGADPYLNKLLMSYCDEALSYKLKARDSFRARVENEIAPLLPHGHAQADKVARQLGVSPRTFARRLSLEGLTFSELLDELRANLAHRHLSDRDLTISQIAWLLGYREVGSFSHAFKRWTGKTPREARAA